MLVLLISLLILCILFIQQKIISYKKTNLLAQDVSGLNLIQIDRVINIHTIGNIIDAITLAKNNKLQLSMFGKKHSMGGQTIAKGGIQLDMNKFNKILKFDQKNKLITVQPGISWGELIYYLNQYSMSPMTLQSYCSFSVGGSISVNAHGITNDYGIYESIHEFKIIMSNLKIETCNRDINSELFSLVIGGYGLFGVICEITLKIVSNENIKLEKVNLTKENFVSIYNSYLDDNEINIKFARIDITNMNDIFLYCYRSTKEKIKSKLDKDPNKMSYLKQIMYKWIYQNENIKKIRYQIEKTFDKPLDQNNNSSRNEILYESADPLAKLYSPLIELDKTHILQEYFIPNNKFDIFINKLAAIYKNIILKYKHHINLLNITIRYIKKDNTTFLKYGTSSMYAFVFYYRIDKSRMAESKLRIIHYMLTYLTLELDGTFYLPYREHYTKNQLLLAYPMIQEFIKLKYKYDPNSMFTNQMFDYWTKILRL